MQSSYMKYHTNLGLQCDNLLIFILYTYTNVSFKIIKSFTPVAIPSQTEVTLNPLSSSVCIIQSANRAGRVSLLSVLLASVQFTSSGSVSSHRSLVIFRMYGRRTGVAGHNAMATGWTDFRVR